MRFGHWHDMLAPSLEDFEMMAAAAWQELPAEFRERCHDIVFRVQDYAADEVLDALEIDDPFELMGLYQGVALTESSVQDLPRPPNMIYLYRRAILDEWAEGDSTLRELVSHVLVHEVGHHFGLSDADMESIEAGVGHSGR